MRCPRCTFEGEPIDGGCARCGYGRARMSTASMPLASREVVVAAPIGVAVRPLVRGDSLRQGRYRVVEALELPKNQQSQGKAWLVTDGQALNRLVMIREVAPAPDAASHTERELRIVAQRLAELGQYPGFPHLSDMFGERGNYYLVLQHPEGKSLAQLVQQQGGALPERVVAEYGRQLCEILNVLASQQPPLVHGSVNPDNIIVSPDGKQITLIHIPLFTPTSPLEFKGKTVSGYLAPEQVNGVIDARGDLYGVAVSMYHALTGYDPTLHMAFFYPPARRLNPKISPRMEAILTRGLRLSAAQRYGRPQDMLRDIGTLLASYPARTATRVASPEWDLRPVRRGNSSRSTMVLFAIVTVLVFALLFGGIFFATARSPSAPTLNPGATATANAVQAQTLIQAQQAETASRAETALETQSMRQGVGVSDGRFIFDTYAGRRDVSLKTQAAQALQANDVDTAATDFAAAVAADPNDGEAQIYNADMQIVQNGLPYLTMVVGMGFDNQPADIAVARSNLQAAFVAQYEINAFSLWPHNLQLRILIAGSGPSDVSVAMAAQFIANRVVKADNLDHIIAVIGWPSGSQSLKARDIIAAAHIPMISQTAADVNLSGSPYFFRVNAPNNAQGDALGTIAVQQMHAKTILVARSPSNVASGELADAFVARVQELHGKVLQNAADTFTPLVTTVDGYKTIVQDAVTAKASLIFTTGSAVDAARLAHAVGLAARTDPGNAVLANLKILGGPALANALLLGQGTSADALLARTFPQDMKRLNFIALADSSEWSTIPQNRWPTFFTEWTGLFQNNPIVANNAPAPDQNAILTYDAVWVVGKAATYVSGAFTGQRMRDALSALGTGKIAAFQGASGRIAFDALGNPTDKAIAYLNIVLNGKTGTYQFKTMQIIGTFR